MLRSTMRVLVKQIQQIFHPGWEISLRLELLKKARQEEGGEEEDDGPEENIWDIGPVLTAGRTYELSMECVTHLEKEESQVSIVIKQL